ncbi:MAG: hypothetical protein J0M18_12520 [Ignavibacteria bacterium]|nr:hypothetical protein [Ignavibacteria bacterium]
MVSIAEKWMNERTSVKQLLSRNQTFSDQVLAHRILVPTMDPNTLSFANNERAAAPNQTDAEESKLVNSARDERNEPSTTNCK